MNPTTEVMVQKAEGIAEKLRGQGWTRRDFANQLGIEMGVAAGGPVPVEVFRGGAAGVGLTKFPAIEAAYLRAAAGNQAAGQACRPVGINDVHGKRWLLAGGVRFITLRRHEVTYRLRSSQVRKAFASITPR